MNTPTAVTSDRLYRIMRFEHVASLFAAEELHFSHPSAWEDPYETRLKHSLQDQLFCQCWNTVAESDAMWRIYSSNGLGVRVATTKTKLRNAVRKHCAEIGAKQRLRMVKYRTPLRIRSETLGIIQRLRDGEDPAAATDMLYLKRSAFSHEKECRATILTREPIESYAKGVKVSVDPHELVDSLTLDPRAPLALVEALTLYFREVCEFKGIVSQSGLYRPYGYRKIRPFIDDR